MYRFVFSKGIRSIQFDPPTTNKIPIRISRENEIVRCVKTMLAHYDRSVDSSSGEHAKAEKITGELDRLFYEVFELTEDEIRMVEEASG